MQAGIKMALILKRVPSYISSTHKKRSNRDPRKKKGKHRKKRKENERDIRTWKPKKNVDLLWNIYGGTRR